MSNTLTVVTVTLEDRGDGGLRVSSEELPGLILSGANKDSVFRQIETAIKAIFEFNGFADVSVKHTVSPEEALRAPRPRDVQMVVNGANQQVKTERFVVELPLAA